MKLLNSIDVSLDLETIVAIVLFKMHPEDMDNYAINTQEYIEDCYSNFNLDKIRHLVKENIEEYGFSDVFRYLSI